MASAAAVTPLRLLHMRPLQHWLHSRVRDGHGAAGILWVNITQECRRSFSPWMDLAFLRAGVPLEQVYRHVVVTTDASSTGWGATCNRQAASGLWTGPWLLWHINCLELLEMHLALRQFRPLLLGKHVLVRTDNTAAVSYINRLGGIWSRRMSQLACHLLLWSHTQLKSLRAVHILGELNRAADALSRQLKFPGEWRLHPKTIRLIWSRFREAQVDLFASRESSHCQLYFSAKTALLTSKHFRWALWALCSGRPTLMLFWDPGLDTCLRFPPRPSVIRWWTIKLNLNLNLQALPSEEADPALVLLCPIRALCIYVDCTRSFRSSEQLFLCHGGQQKGKAVSKQRLAHWIVDAIALAYQSQGEPCPLGVRAHSTRSVASSYALAHGASLADICRAVGWATPNTFARF